MGAINDDLATKHVITHDTTEFPTTVDSDRSEFITFVLLKVYLSIEYGVRAFAALIIQT